MIEQLLKAYPSCNRRDGLPPPLDDTDSSFSAWWSPITSAGLSALVRSHWPFADGRLFLGERTTAVSLLNSLLRHGIVVGTSGEALR